MNKGALFGKLLIATILALIIFIFLSAYIKFNKDNVEITTGDVTINIDYNNTKNTDKQTDVISMPENSQGTAHINSTLTNLTNTNQTNSSQ